MTDANTLTLISAALDERERVEAGLPSAEWFAATDQRALGDLRNAAPADNAMHRALFDLAKGWLVPTDGHMPEIISIGEVLGDKTATEARTRHDAAERILSLLAQALLPQGVTK